MTISRRWLLIVSIGLFIAVGVTSRFVQQYNFAAIGALAIFCGTFVKSRWGVLIPVAVMAVTDTIIGWHSLVLFTWGAYALAGMVGWWIREHRTIIRTASGSLIGSVIFYMVTNAAVWAFTPLYAKNAAGLLQSYIMAIPFFRNSAVSDLLFVGVFFGAYETALHMVARREKAMIMKRQSIVNN